MRTRFRQTLFCGLLLACLALAVGPWSPVTATGDRQFGVFLPLLQTHPAPAGAQAYRELAAIIDARGNVPVLIHLAMPDFGAETAGIAAAQEAAIVDATQGVLAALGRYHVENIKTFQYTPVLAVTLTEVEALNALANDEWVVKVEEDRLESPALSESVPIVGANFFQQRFLGGFGQSIAILDTGVDSFHPALEGKVIRWACFSTNNEAQGMRSLCPNGVTESTGLYSGEACSRFITGCDHGTHVAGIAAGVAPSAQLIAIQVFSRFADSPGNTACADSNRTSPCTRGFVSDQIKALEHVRALHTANNGITIAAVNMSLGGVGETAACTNDVRRIIIRDLRDNHGIVVVVSTGNSGLRNAISAPACIPEAFSVAASDKNDVIAGYSNIASFADVIAPGTNIYAPVHRPNYHAYNGTSMAAPHVAGAVAVLRSMVQNKSVTEIENALRNSGVSITDTRPNNIGITKRRFDLVHAHCLLTSCDSDDLRTLVLNTPVSGNIQPTGDHDSYYFRAVAGQVISVRMNAILGALTPYIELWDPSGERVARNSNGGGNGNALIGNYPIQKNGVYRIVARGGVGTGQYQLTVSAQSTQFNPLPRISRLSPNPVTGTVNGTDFWLAVYGENFLPTSYGVWNGQLRPMFYNNPGLVYIRLQRSDTNMFAPRFSNIAVFNPGPGGGLSNQALFGVTPPILGESAMLEPANESTIQTGIQTSFAISWTAPITATTWRSMQSMDLRIRNEKNEIAAWVRVVEQPGQDSFYRLLTSGENQADVGEELQVLEGRPGEPKTLVISDTVTLHLEESTFFGSGLTAIMTPVITFGPNAVGTWNVEFRVDRKYQEGDEEDEEEGAELVLVQDEDVLGIIHIVPAECPAAVSNVSLNGPDTALVGDIGTYTAARSPLEPTAPVSYTWAPTPSLDGNANTAHYTWSTPGLHTVSVFVENCGGFAADVLEVAVASSPDPDLMIAKYGPPAVLSGETFTYTLTVANTGAVTATNLVITDVVPAGVIHPQESTVVTWAVPELGPYGATTEVSYTVAASLSAGNVITNHDYGVTTEGGRWATGSGPVVTKVVQAARRLDNDTGQTLYTGPNPEDSPVTLEVPPGAVFTPLLLTLDALGELPYPVAEDQEWRGVAFEVGAFQDGKPAPDARLSERISVTVRLLTLQTVTGEEDALHYWTGEQWSSEGIQCSQKESENGLRCLADGMAVGVYALLRVQTPPEEEGEYALTVAIVGMGGVAINPARALYAANEPVTLTATPDAGWRFSGWSGDASGADNPLTVAITDHTNITATFVEEDPVEEEPAERILIPVLQLNSR